ncbi:unnamed protein product [Bursaphelenchus xylophilus]|uniref:(pine wood nematode) hypothetical protein n=1 Tax=Bursaphelenchus xylophilus TaxID=6326 RepID=A0A7I8X0Q1_BURXY|nr:unnamed protein product [Bursaphelenchus xylophilus]CAG9129785.1 unnamed protein product [Bursaphelenchus xylophilus]
MSKRARGDNLIRLGAKKLHRNSVNPVTIPDKKADKLCGISTETIPLALFRPPSLSVLSHDRFGEPSFRWDPPILASDRPISVVAGIEKRFAVFL